MPKHKRKHTNTKGLRQIQRGKTADQVDKIRKRIFKRRPSGLYVPKEEA